MDRVRARVAGLLGDLLRLDHLDDLRVARVGLGVEDVDARGAQARHDEVAPLDVRMRRVRAEARRAGVPAEMVQLVAGIRHRDAADDLRIGAALSGRRRRRRWRRASSAADRRPRRRRASRARPSRPCAATDRSSDRDAKWPFRPPCSRMCSPPNRQRSVRARETANTSCAVCRLRRQATKRRRCFVGPIGAMILSDAQAAGSTSGGLSPGCRASALLAQEDDEPRGDDDRRADEGVGLGTSPKTTKPKTIAQTISVYW